MLMRPQSLFSLSVAHVKTLVTSRVLDYMLPPSQTSVSMSTIFSGMRHNHKQEGDKLLRPPLTNALG